MSVRASSCQTAQDGAFLEISTWDCGCDPMQCDTLIIHHALTLSDNLDLGSVTLLIDQGSLVGPWMVTLAGPFHNAGTVDLSELRFSYPASVLNESTIMADLIVGITASFSNTGALELTDSLDVYSILDPVNTGSIIAQVIGLAPLCLNSGTLNCDVLRFGTLQNDGEVRCHSIGTPVNPVFNTGIFRADTLAIGQYFENGETAHAECSMLYLTGELQNHGMLRVYGAAYNGFMGAGGDMQMFANAATEVQNYIGAAQSILRGPGTLCIAEHSENHGTISGPIGICDVSPGSSTIPFMDVHDGDVLLPVLACSAGGCSTVGLPESESMSSPVVFPQPANSSFFLSLGSQNMKASRIRLLDSTGRVILVLAPPFSEPVRVDLSEQADGVYVLQTLDDVGKAAFSSRVFIGSR